MPELTMGLAWFNLLPVFFTAVALWFLIRLVAALDPRQRDLAWSGAILILCGGLAKASWKLLWVLTGQDVIWLSQALFPLIAPGFTLLAAALWPRADQPRRRGLATRRALVTLLLLAVAAMALIRTFGLGMERGWFVPLLVLASGANLVLSLLLMRLAWSQRRVGLTTLLGVQLLLVFALPPIALAGAHSLSMHWLEQILTTLGMAVFAFVVYRLDALARAGRPITPL
ncbi:hypothetical protein [Thiocapsa imhoffii]|nr:hypothetical protein [Thiocapsa imhoffii]